MDLRGSGQSDEWLSPDVARTLTRVICRLKTIGSTPTVVTVYRNGVAVSPTVTIAAGAKLGMGSFSTRFNPLDDYLTVEATTRGNGGEAG